MGLVKFLISGVLAAAVEYGIFLTIQDFFGRESLVVAQTTSFLAGFIVSFTLNKFWVFKSGNSIISELPKYLTLLGINLIITNIILGVLVTQFDVAEWGAKILVMVMVATWNYIIFKKIIFKSKE